jgi:hypothetical protein
MPLTPADHQNHDSQRIPPGGDDRTGSADGASVLDSFTPSRENAIRPVPVSGAIDSASIPAVVRKLADVSAVMGKSHDT